MTLKPLPPCQAACPVHTEARDYVRLISEGRYNEAFRVICRTNPFPSVCAHVCQRPCEKQCRRRDVDQAVGIRALKRFVVEHSGAARPAPEPLPGALSDGMMVAVVGAGPSGLTAALDLRLAGLSVQVFERLNRAGGMLNVIPRYRLPQSALDADVEHIRATGVKIATGVEVGRDVSVADLLDRGFQAVIVTTGLSRSRGIAVPGFGAQRFTAAIPWMTDVWLGNRVDVGRRVAVIGGGNVAVDVARTARRLGADLVTMICVESRDEMPAEPDEIELAEAEGIQLLPRQALKRVMNRDGRIAALELMRVVSVFDQEGRFRPTYDPARIRTLGADMVILSIGQAPDRSWARGLTVQTDERGRVVTDHQTGVTSHSRIFVAGETLRGPGSAIQAVAEGHRAAAVVANFLLKSGDAMPGLRGVVCPGRSCPAGSSPTARSAPPDEIARGTLVPSPDFRAPADEARPLDPLPPATRARLRQLERVVAEAKPFATSEPTVSEADALREAGRCLGCVAGAVIDEGKCAACLTCHRVCPLSAINAGDPVVADPVRCQACGLCAAVCPAKAIDLTWWAFPWNDVPAAPRGGGPATAVLLCRHHSDGAVAKGQVLAHRVPRGTAVSKGTAPETAAPAPLGEPLRAVIRVPCLARLRPIDLLRVVGRGYGTVVLQACAEEACKYGRAWGNIQSVAEYARGILKNIGRAAAIEVAEAQTARSGG